MPWVSVRSVGRRESFRVPPGAGEQMQQQPVMGRWLRLNGWFGFEVASLADQGAVLAFQRGDRGRCLRYLSGICWDAGDEMGVFCRK